MPRLLIDGSSTAYGCGGGSGGGWADRLKQEMVRRSDAFDRTAASTYNFSQPCRNINEITDQLPDNLMRHKGYSIGNIVLLQVGMSESRRLKSQPATTMTLLEFDRQLSRAEDLCYGADFLPIFVGIPPFGPDPIKRFGAFGDDYYPQDRQDFADAVRAHSADSGTAYVDVANPLLAVFGTISPMLARDRLHINEPAHQLLYERLLPIVDIAISSCSDYYRTRDRRAG